MLQRFLEHWIFINWSKERQTGTVRTNDPLMLKTFSRSNGTTLEKTREKFKNREKTAYLLSPRPFKINMSRCLLNVEWPQEISDYLSTEIFSPFKNLKLMATEP